MHNGFYWYTDKLLSILIMKVKQFKTCRKHRPQDPGGLSPCYNKRVWAY